MTPREIVAKIVKDIQGSIRRTTYGDQFEITYRDSPWCDLISEAIAEEREACAKIADEIAFNENWTKGSKLAAQIRARHSSAPSSTSASSSS